jgi:hypothetical protein
MIPYVFPVLLSIDFRAGKKVIKSYAASSGVRQPREESPK